MPQTFLSGLMDLWAGGLKMLKGGVDGRQGGQMAA